MAIFGNGTGMGFAICGDTQSVTSWESTVNNFFSVQVLPRISSQTGANISSGRVVVNFNGSVSSIALSAINAVYITPSYAATRFNQDNGNIETFDAVTETWKIFGK